MILVYPAGLASACTLVAPLARRQWTFAQQHFQELALLLFFDTHGQRSQGHFTIRTLRILTLPQS